MTKYVAGIDTVMYVDILKPEVTCIHRWIWRLSSGHGDSWRKLPKFHTSLCFGKASNGTGAVAFEGKVFISELNTDSGAASEKSFE